MADFDAPRASPVLPPTELRPLSGASSWGDFRIDYATHPAYRPLLRFRPVTLLKFALSSVKLLAKRLINYESIPFDLRRGPKTRFAAAGLFNLLHGGSFGSILKRAYGGPLGNTGCIVVGLSPEDTKNLHSVAAASFANLERRRAAPVTGVREFEESRSTASRARAQALFDLIEALFDKSGIMSIASAYLGRAARLIDVNPQINDPSDSYWRNIFPDMKPNSLPRTAYCHRDASGGDLKAIIYVSDVGPTNGPFAYAVGSNRVHLSRIDDFICEANDMNGFAGTAPEARAAFAALPRTLQQKGSFGNDLADDAPASHAIMDSLWSITGSAGSIVLFDTKGIHRGGMVIEGERRVLTCVLG